MLSEDELEKEIRRINKNKYGNIEGVKHVNNFSSESYINGIKYAMGEDIERKEFPNVNTVQKIILRIKDNFDIEYIEIERGGDPPRYIEFAIRVYKKIDSVEEHMEVESDMRKIAREEESGSERVYISLERNV